MSNMTLCHAACNTEKKYKISKTMSDITYSLCLFN